MSYSTAGTGLRALAEPPVTPVLVGLPLTNDDFRTHRAPLPTPHMINLTNRLHAVPVEKPCLSYVISTSDDTPWSPYA